MMEISKIYESNNFGKLKIIEYVDCCNVKVQFINTGCVVKARAGDIRLGKVKDRLAPHVYGVGFVGIGKYACRVKRKDTKEYTAWHNMLKRCYSEKHLKKHPSYIGCSVCVEWHNFQVFAHWFEANYIDGTELDKDIILDGNKVYSPETCLFVSHTENVVKATAKKYKFINPSNELVEVYNLREFCRERDLCSGHMSSVHTGNRRQHKGWRAN